MMEGKRLLRNPKWKYLILVFIGAYFYYSLTYNNLNITTSSSFGMFPAVTHDQLLISIAMTPSLLYAILLYHIAILEEPIGTWSLLLTYPMPQQKRILLKCLCLILFLLPAGISSYIFYQYIGGQQPDIFLKFFICIHTIYLISFFYYCFYVSRGYIASGGSITILNILERITPVFLFFCVMNSGQWSIVFTRMWVGIIVTAILLFVILLMFSSHMMHTKLYREIVLSKLFKTVSMSMGQIIFAQYRGMFDTLIQCIFRKLDRGHAGYWEKCATIEVVIKQQFYTILMAIFFFILALSYHITFLYVISLFFIVLTALRLRRKDRRIERIRILPNAEES